MMRKLLLCLLSAMVACTTPTPDTELAGDSFERGRYEEAYRQLDAAVDRSPDNPLLREKAELARSAILKRQIEAARAAEKRGRIDEALEELRAGVPYDSRGVAREEIERLEAERDRVAADLAEARSLASRGENREAAAILASLSRYQATFPEIRDLTARVSRAEAVGLDQSRRAGAQAILAQARDALSEGRAGSALASLDAADPSVREDPGFRTEAARIRTEIADRLLREAEVHGRSGRPALAQLLARAASRADPASSRARSAEASYSAEAGREYAIRIRLDTIDDATGGRVDPRTFTRQVAEIFRRSATYPWIEIAGAGAAPDLAASGTVTALNVAVAPPQERQKVHQYSRGIEQEVNPEHERLRERATELEDVLREADKRLEEIEWELFYLERLQASSTTLRSGRRRFGDYSEAAYYRILRDTRSREAGIRNLRDRTSKDLSQVRDRLDRTPLYLERELVSEVPYEERTVGKLATARGTFKLEAAHEILGFRTRTGDLEAEAGATDRVVAGLPEIGLNPDPNELPSDAKLARQALRGLAERFAEEIGRRASGLRLGLIPDARRLEAEEDEDGALERYAAFALGTGDHFRLEQANASMRIFARYGIEITGGKLELGGLKLD